MRKKILLTILLFISFIALFFIGIKHIKADSDETVNVTITEDELFSDYYDKADKLMEKMTIEEKVSQMFYARYPSAKKANEEIKKYNPGGYILFAKDFKGKTKKSMKKQLSKNQKTAKINMFLGVDEEGGTVVRVSRYKAFRKSKFKSPQELWKKGYLNKIIKDSKEKSQLLKSIGLNMNFAPVVDVPTKKKSFIYKRSYGRGATKTAIYTEKIVQRMNKDKMISTLKHFPGYGDNKDTHTGVAIDKRSYKTLKSKDLKPFISGIKAGAPFVLVSHNIVKCIDKSKPASLSKKVHNVLRKDLKFSGLIITDDLAMKAISKYTKTKSSAVDAVLAGNDMLISSSFKKQRKEVINAVKNGTISEERINESVRRILACKYAYGIIK